jgi:D-alanine-D-alanine ligase-like ATP-grasp enzyme
MESTKLSKLEYCPFCYPEKVDHKQTKRNSFLMAYINNPLSTFFKLFFLGKPIYFSDRFLVVLIKILQKWGKVKLQRDAKPEQMVTRLRLLWNEAKSRQLSIHSFSLYNRQLLSFLLIYKGKKHHFHYSPTTLLHKYFRHYKDPTIYDDKAKFKKLLVKHNLPYPEGRAFFSRNKAFAYGLKLGFPLVVKPAASSLSQHITLQIMDQAALKKAIMVAKTIDCRIIIERFVPGFAHRMMCVGEQFLVCSKRMPPNITGNGKLTVNELIDDYNNHPLRGEVGEVGYALYKVNKDNQLSEYLAAQGLSLESFLEKDRTIYLADKSNCSNGAEVINLNEHVCQENIELFKKLHSSLSVAVSAVDFICSDVAQPWHLQSFAFLENNSFPAIDPQHYPSSGKPVNVAGAIWEYVLQQLNNQKETKK